MGGVVEEEMEGFRKVVEVVLGEVAKNGATKQDEAAASVVAQP